MAGFFEHSDEHPDSGSTDLITLYYVAVNFACACNYVLSSEQKYELL
jgi:hypothetical protein